MVNFQKKFNDNILNSGELGGMDINSLLSTTQPPEFILKLIIIQRREDFHNSLDTYMKQKGNGIKPSIATIKARLFSLFFVLRASVRQHLISNPTEFDKMEETIMNSKDFSELYTIGCDIEDYLLTKGVTKFDNIKGAPIWSIEEQNKNKGYY